MEDRQKEMTGVLYLFRDEVSKFCDWKFIQDSKKGSTPDRVVTSIRSGDHLTVFAHPVQQEKAWVGTVDLDNKSTSATVSRFGLFDEEAKAVTVSAQGFQRNLAPEAWATMFIKGYRATLVRASERKEAAPQPA